jgi:hypothetical protein
VAKSVKQIPERRRLNESIIKNDLIDPYKSILKKAVNLDKVLHE